MTIESRSSSPGPQANPLQPVLFEVKRTIVGQDIALERMAIALLSGGHLLVEGVPGLAKTLSVKSPSRSSSWRRRTRSSPRAPTRCPRRRSTGS